MKNASKIASTQHGKSKKEHIKHAMKHHIMLRNWVDLNLSQGMDQDHKQNDILTSILTKITRT